MVNIYSVVPIAQNKRMQFVQDADLDYITQLPADKRAPETGKVPVGLYEGWTSPKHLER